MVGSGEVEAAGLKATRPEVLLDVLRNMWGFLEVDCSSVDKSDKEKFRCRLAP